MRFRRVTWLAATTLASLICLSCGQIYRPVVIPTTITPPNPASYHAIFAVNTNAPFNFGTGTEIDVSGDAEIGTDNVGVNPTHAAILPNFSRVFIANSGSLYAGQSDSITAFAPAVDVTSATGLGPAQTFSLPAGSLPVFLNTSQNNAMFVANYGTNSVSELSAQTNALTLTGAAGANPVAMAETPNGQNLYVANQGDNTVSNLSPVDLSTQATIQVGNTPAWIVSRVDGQRVYVITQGDGNLYTINTVTNAVISVQSVGGAGANYAFYDTSHNRLYVTNPTAGTVSVFDATTDPPTPLVTVTIPSPPIASNTLITTNCTTYTCTYGPVTPTAVSALGDGTRFYVASYVVGNATSSSNPTTCPDTNVTASGCIIPQVTVFDANTFAVKTTVFPLLNSYSTAQPFAVAPIASCAPVFPYTPASTRFRMSAAAAADSSNVYASVCDGGFVAVVQTNTNTVAVNGNVPDTLVTDLLAPFGAGPPASNGQPSLQTPVFLLAGQ